MKNSSLQNILKQTGDSWSKWQFWVRFLAFILMSPLLILWQLGTWSDELIDYIAEALPRIPKDK